MNRDSRIGVETTSWFFRMLPDISGYFRLNAGNRTLRRPAPIVMTIEGFTQGHSVQPLTL